MKKLGILLLSSVLGACSVLPTKTVSGTFQGELPCADCEKIQAKLVLNSDNTYTYDSIYFKNKEQIPFSEKGIYKWDEKKSNVIRLTASDNMAVFVSDHYVEFRDSDGNPVSGNLNYKLNKVTP